MQPSSKIHATLKRYHPGPDSAKFHEASQSGKDVVVIAPIRSGKSYSLIHDIMVSAWNSPYSAFDGSDVGVLVTAPTWRQVGTLLEEPLTRAFIRAGLLAEHCAGGEGHNKSDHRTILKNGRIIYYRSLENYDISIRGLNVSKAYIDEGPYAKKEAVDVVKGRLLTTGGTLIICGTPTGTSSWFYGEYFGPDAKPHVGTEFVKFHLFNNPTITEDAFHKLLAEYDPLLARQELYAEWVNLTENLVYYMFEDGRNVSQVPFTSREPIFICVDYNVGKNAYVVLQKDVRRNRINCVAEGYGNRTTRDMGLRIISDWGRDVYIIDDASGSQRQQGDGKTQREILNQVGLWRTMSTRSNPAVEKRRAVVNAHYMNGLGNSHLFIDPRCKRLIEENRTYCFKPNSDQPETEGGKKGHITDALGYGVWYLSGGKAAWEPPAVPKAA